MSNQRVLAVIMFTDIVGYTSLMGEDQSRAIHLLRKNREIQKPLIDQHGGTFLKEMGDGILASFKTPSDAIYCARDIQKSAGSDPDLNLRIGMHLGEVITENQDIFGDGVNIASRIEALADSGGVYLSESVEKAVRGQSDIQCEFLGEMELKNVNYPVKVFALKGEGLPIPSPEEKELTGTFKAELERRKVVRAGLAYIFVAGLLAMLAQFVVARGVCQFPWSYMDDPWIRISSGSLLCMEL